MGFNWTLAMRLVFQSFCTTVRTVQVEIKIFRQPGLSFEGALPVVNSADDWC